MTNFNIGRWILGGLIAGIISDALGFLVDGVWLAQRWSDGMAALGHTDFSQNQWIWFNIAGLVTGMAAIWVYAAIRPRFGAGVMTAIYAGLAVWVIGILVPNFTFMVAAGLFRGQGHLSIYTTLGGLVEMVVGTVAGAALYNE